MSGVGLLIRRSLVRAQVEEPYKTRACVNTQAFRLSKRDENVTNPARCVLPLYCAQFETLQTTDFPSKTWHTDPP